MSMIHKTRMDKNIFTALDPWILSCSCGRDQVSFSFLSCFLLSRKCKQMLLRHSRSIPHMRTRRTFGRKEKKRDENGNNRKAVAVYFDAFALIAIILTSNTRGKLWKEWKWNKILFLIKSGIRRINHRNFAAAIPGGNLTVSAGSSYCIIDFRLNSMKQRPDRGCV